MRTRFSIRALAAAAMLALGLLPWPALALITQGYRYNGTLLDGGLVSADASDPRTVVLASTQNASRLVGVMVPPGSSAITLSQQGEVQVASSGTVEVNVSDENGAIKKGDYVGVSSIAGVGAKAVKSGWVIGTAQQAFTGQEAGDAHVSVGSKLASVGQIPVALYVGTADVSTGPGGGQVPASLAKLAQLVAGHQVSALRIILAMLILLAGLVSVAVILYGAVSNSFLSIGRNPLASHSIYRGLLQVGGLALALLAACIAAMYAAVRL